MMKRQQLAPWRKDTVSRIHVVDFIYYLYKFGFFHGRLCTLSENVTKWYDPNTGALINYTAHPENNHHRRL
jgi:hypothetical protein